MSLLVRVLALFVVSISLLFPAFSHEVKQGNLTINQTIIPATVKSAPVAAGYMTITNTGDTADRLISFEADFTGKTSIHTMKMEDGVMKMRPLSNGLEIPAGETVTLKKGGFHLMFMKLQEQMETGQMRDIVLNFEKAGRIGVKMMVVDPAKMGGEEMDHSDHSGHSTTTN